MYIITLFFLLISSSFSSERIISTVPSLTEILYELGLDKEVVGVSNYCLFDETYCQKEKIGTSLSFSYEKIIKLNSNIIILSNNTNKSQLSNLKKLKIDTIILGHERLTDIYQAISILGKRFSKGNEVNTILNKLKKSLEYKSKVEIKKKVLFLISSQVKNNKIVKVQAVGSKNFYTDILKKMKIDNVLQMNSLSYPEIGREKLLTLDYDYIIEIFGSHNEESIGIKKRAWKQLLTERNKVIKYISLNGDYLYIPGPSVWKIARDIKISLEGE